MLNIFLSYVTERDTYVFLSVTPKTKRGTGEYLRANVPFSSLKDMLACLVNILANEQEMCHPSKINIEKIYYLGGPHPFYMRNDDDPRTILHHPPMILGLIYGNDHVINLFLDSNYSRIIHCHYEWFFTQLCIQGSKIVYFVEGMAMDKAREGARESRPLYVPL